MSQLVETEIGTIASDWKVCSLDEICEPPQYGFTASAGKKGNTQFLRITDITESGIKWGTVPYCKCPEKILSKYLLASGDIVFARIGATTGKSYLIADPPPSVFASYLIRVRPKKVVDSGFLSHFFRTTGYWQQIDAQKGSNLKKGVNGSLLKKLIVPVPPLPEQKKIAHILSTVQRAIEEQERIIQITTELKNALMHKLFTEGLRNEPQKETEIGPVPESWEVKRFDSFAVLQRGFDITKKDQRPGDFPVVSSGGISSCHDEAKVKGPGVVIGRKGSLGTVHYIASDYWPHDTTLWVKDFKGNNPRFVAYLLETMRLKRFDTGAANPTLNRNIVHGEKIALPPTDQQVEIGAALEAVESKILIHERRKRSFQNLFRTLLHELMTAKTRVQELDIK